MRFSARSLSIVISCSAFALAPSFAGCDSGSGSSGGGSTTGTTTDGRFHPSPDGTHVSEKAACDALVKEQQKQLLALHCVGTGQTCPSFLRAEFQTACMEYDQGSVTGCIAYYVQQTTCDALKAAVDDCVITAYPGTEPAGCPAGGTGGTGGTTSSGGTGGVGGATGGTGGVGGATGGATTGGGGIGGVGGSTSSGGTGGMTSSGGTGGV